jgi:hypothetical protein
MSTLPCHDRQRPHPCATGLRPPRSAFAQRLVDGAGCWRRDVRPRAMAAFARSWRRERQNDSVF